MKKGEVYEGIIEQIEFPNKGKVVVDGQTVIVKNGMPGQKVRRKEFLPFCQLIIIHIMLVVNERVICILLCRTKKRCCHNDNTFKIIQVTRWAAYPSSQVLLRVCREPFRPLLLGYYSMPSLCIYYKTSILITANCGIK